MTFPEYQAFARTVSDRAEKLRNAILNDARRTCKAAGLSPDLLGIHPHNAMCSYEAGKPWPEVDYSLCRRTIWLLNKAGEPSAIAGRIINRAWQRHVQAGRQR